jgi:tetratricopeptide (TPR) repeat protein
LVLEDIQWLDEASSGILADLLQGSTDWPLLILVSSREPLDQPFPECLEAEMVPLPALPSGAIRQLVEVWAAPDLLPESTVEAICERAEGHPYFARELVHALRQGSTSGVGAVGLPHTLQELFLAQLDWLPLESRRLVQAASVLGEPLSAELLEAAMGTGTELTPSLLAEATRAGLLRPAPAPEQFVFGRRLLFEAAYATIPTSRRRDVHSRVADHIIKQQESLGTGAIHTAAHHAYLGFGDERAIGLLLESARRYRLEYSNHQAIRDAMRATEVMSSLPNPAAFTEQRLEALWLLAQSYEVLGDLDRAEGVLAEAEILLDESENQQMVAQIALSSGTLHLMRGDLNEAAKHYARAREEWEALGDPTRVAHSLLGLGMCASADGDRTRALSVFREAAELPGVELWARAAALNNAGATLLSEGSYSAAEPYLLAGLEANQQEGDRRGVAHSKASLGELCYRLTRTAEAAKWLDEALAEAEEIEDPIGTAVATLLKVRLLLHGRQVDLADEALRSADLQAGVDAEIDALSALTQTELSLAKGTWPRGVELSDEAPEACGTSAVCLNAAAEMQCLLVEAGLRSGGPPAVEEAQGRLTDRLGRAPDQHLRRYGEWLRSLDMSMLRTASPLPPSADNEQTVLDVRAHRLVSSR